MLRLTIWMNMPSFYQEDLFESLLASREVDLQVVFARELAADRVRLGWGKKSRKYLNCNLAGKLAIWEVIQIAWLQRKRLHVVSGLWAEPSFLAALCVLMLAGSTFVICAEAPDPTQVRSRVKQYLQAAFGRLVARHAAGVLAISHFAIDYYTRLGFCKERVYAFGYFRANSDLPDNPERLVNKRTEVIFIGQIIPRKGLDILLEAMLPLFTEYPSLCLTLVGDGEDIPTLRTRVHSLGLHERVALEGVIPSDQIQTRLAAADVLVLPSRWDGWGLVVNEAFSVGTPVIVSDRCGAADLIKQGVNGYVFRSENLEELRSCLRSFLNTGSWTTLKSAAARTGQAISTEIVTPYMIECLQHLTNGSGNRPIPPWIQLAIPQTED